MTPELTSVLTQFMGGAGGMKGALKALGMYQYYRQPGGSIVLSPAFATDMLRYMMEGWVPLTKYGRIKLNQHNHENKFEWLFQRGGQGELTKEQLVEEGFHFRKTRVPGCGMWVQQTESHQFQEERMRDTIIVGRPHFHDTQCYADGWVVEFPQFQAGTPESYPCQFCSDVHTGQRALERHISISHKDRLAAFATANALTAALSQFQAIPPVAQKAISAANPFQCGSCGTSYATPGALIEHVQECIGDVSATTVTKDVTEEDPE